MAFSTPNTYTTATDVDADDVAENFTAAREYIQRIAIADVGSSVITDYHIAKPEKVSKSTWRFTSGVFVGNSTQFNELDKHYVTNHVKQAEFTGLPRYQDVPNACTLFFLEKRAHVVVKVYGWADACVNMEQSDAGHSQRYTLFVDDELQTATANHVGDNGAATTASLFEGDGRVRRIPISILWAGDLSAGTHTIAVKIDPRLEMSWHNNLTFIVDTMYRST